MPRVITSAAERLNPHLKINEVLAYFCTLHLIALGHGLVAM